MFWFGYYFAKFFFLPIKLLRGWHYGGENTVKRMVNVIAKKSK